MNNFRWITVTSRDELQMLYQSLLPKLREAARECGYALGVHGSMKRDLDLIAVPWVAEHRSKDELARALSIAACGLERLNYQWEEKPVGRSATCFPICFPDEMEIVPSLGHIDLSVVGIT